MYCFNMSKSLLFHVTVQRDQELIWHFTVDFHYNAARIRRKCHCTQTVTTSRIIVNCLVKGGLSKKYMYLKQHFIVSVVSELIIIRDYCMIPDHQALHYKYICLSLGNCEDVVEAVKCISNSS